MFKLLRYFSLASAVAIVAVSAVLALFYRQHEVSQLVGMAQQQNVTLARSFANPIWPRFSSYVTSASRLDAQTLRARPESREIHETVVTLAAGFPVLKVKIFNFYGLTAYSSDPAEIGDRKDGTSRPFALALRGIPVSTLAFKDAFTSLTGTVVRDRVIVESYVPIRGRDGEVEGVFELYSDVTPLMGTIGRSTFKVVAVLVVGLGLLYGLLFFIVRHADRMLRRQYVEIVETEETIKAKNAVLEREVAERKRAVEAARRSEARLANAQRIARIGNWDWDMVKGELHWSDQEYHVLGYDEREVGPSYEAFLRRVHPDDRPRVEKAAAEAIETGEPYEAEFRIVREDGSERIVHEQGEVEFDPAGRRVAMRGIVQDITERKLAERALDRLKRQNELILNSAGEGIYGLDLDGNTTFCNPAAAKMIGWEPEELIGKPQHAILHHTKPDGSPYPRDDCPIYAAFRDGDIHHVSDEVFWRRDGTAFPVEYTSTPIRDEDGELVGAVVVFRDITRRKEAEDALKAAKDEAELANRAKSEFLTTMSHELKTPLNAIIGFSDIIKDGAFGPLGDPKYAEYAGDIRTAGQHLLELINDILDLAKMDAGHAELQEAEVNVTAAVMSCLNLAKGRAEAQDLNFVANVAGDLPTLRADERRLKRIVLNLLSNAVKFTEGGGTVTIEAYVTADGGIAIRISDTGVGMAPEDIPKALTPFSVVDNSLARKHRGTGLGLPITKALVELHGGTLDLESGIGIGTTATVTLPAERVSPRPHLRVVGGGH